METIIDAETARVDRELAVKRHDALDAELAKTRNSAESTAATLENYKRALSKSEADVRGLRALCEKYEAVVNGRQEDFKSALTQNEELKDKMTGIIESTKSVLEENARLNAELEKAQKLRELSESLLKKYEEAEKRSLVVAEAMTAYKARAEAMEAELKEGHEQQRKVLDICGQMEARTVELSERLKAELASNAALLRQMVEIKASVCRDTNCNC